MKINMWNILQFLPYKEEDILEMIKTGDAGIEDVRWIGSGYFKPDAVYIGRAISFFEADENTSIVVHQRDMLLIRNAEPEDVFNEICHIMDNFKKWDQELEAFVNQENGLQKMLSLSRKILGNPAYIYGPDGKILAITEDKGDIHWVWKEILDDRGISVHRMKYLKENIHLSEVFKDTYPKRHTSKMSSYEYIHCSLIVNGYMAGHFVLFGILKPIEKGMESLIMGLIEHLNTYISKNFHSYSPSARSGNLVRDILQNQGNMEDNVNKLCEIMHWNKNDIYRLHLIAEKTSLQEAQTPILLEQLYLRISQQFPYLLLCMTGNFLLMVENNKRIERDGQQEYLIHLMQNDFCCGISCFYRNLENTPVYYLQAGEELKRCTKSLQIFSRGQDHLFQHLADILSNDPTGRCYADENINFLLEYDQLHNTEYFKTLKNWCMCGCHINETADRLRLHRNTVRYRLEKIREFIPLDYYENLIAKGEEKDIDALFYLFCICGKS